MHILKYHKTYLCRMLSFASSICNVPPFHLDLFNTVTPAHKEKKHYPATIGMLYLPATIKKSKMKKQTAYNKHDLVDHIW